MAKSNQLSKEEMVAKFASMRQELNAIAQKVGELESERDEHQLVLDTISKMESERKCFRLIGGVLVERTVKEVIPAVKTNMEGINNVIKQLAETYKRKDEEFVSLQKELSSATTTPTATASSS